MSAATPTGEVEAVLARVAAEHQWHDADCCGADPSWCECGEPDLYLPEEWPAHVASSLAAALRDAPQPEMWPCDDYKAPLTCWTTPKPKTLICEGCRSTFPDGADVQKAYRAPQPSGGALTEEEAMVSVPVRVLRGMLDEVDYEKSNALHGEVERILAARTQPSAQRDPQPSEAAGPGNHEARYADGHRCTCGQNGTPDECAAELAAGGWCPSRRVPLAAQPSAPVSTTAVDLARAWQAGHDGACEFAGNCFGGGCPVHENPHAEAALAQGRESGK